MQLGEITAFPVIMTVLGLAAIFGLERRKIAGRYPDGDHRHLHPRPHLRSESNLAGLLRHAEPEWREWKTLVGSMDLLGALNPVVIPTVLALMTAVFDATGTIRAVAGQAGLINERGHIISGGKALTADSVSSMVAGAVGGAPAAVYIESAAGTAAGGKTGLTATLVGVLFLLMIFLSPLSYLVPAYATAPALMYVGLLMLGNVTKAGLQRLGRCPFRHAVRRLHRAHLQHRHRHHAGLRGPGGRPPVCRQWKKLNIGTVIIAVAW